MALENEEDLDLDLEKHLIEKIDNAINEPGEPKYVVANFYSFKEEVTSLLATLKLNTNPKLKGEWSTIRRRNLYTLNNLVNEWQITKKHTSFTSKEVFDTYENIKKGLKKIKSEIIVESSSKGDGSVSYHVQVPDHPKFERHKREVYRWSSRFAPRKVLGIDHKVLAMERELVLRNMDARFKVFGVVGVAGIGKTTLCQAIFGRGAVKERYSPRLWVCLSKQPQDRGSDYRKGIVVRILKCLGLDDETIDDARNDDIFGLKRLIFLLRLQLLEKRYLIVLDDAWNDDKFFHNLIQEDPMDDTWGEELSYAFPKGSGGTIISSSTSEGLLKNMLGKDVRMEYMKELDNEIIYEIFKDSVIGYDEDEREFSPDLDVLKDELLKKCAGVPFAAKLLAKIACKQLEIKPKAQQTPMGGEEGSRDVKHASTSGIEQRPKDGGGGLAMVLRDQMATMSGNK